MEQKQYDPTMIGEPVKMNMTGGPFRGNLDRSLTLKNTFESTLFWCQLWFKPDDPRYKKKAFEIKAFTSGVWNGFQRNKDAHGIVWWKDLGGYADMKLLHDPRLVKNVDELKIK